MSGNVERVTYHNEENGYCVLRVQVKGHKELVTLVGKVPRVSEGEVVEARGKWTRHKEHGLQFEALDLKLVPPNTTAGVARYLASGLVKGIGPVYAERLAARFGTAIFQVIEEQPERLSEIKGLGQARIARIKKTWQEQKSVFDIMLFLQEHGVGGARAQRIHKAYGAKAVELIRANPFRLAREVRGFGFKLADQIAQSMGVRRDAPERVQAGLEHVLQQMQAQGHCAYPVEQLFEESRALLEVSPGELEQGLAALQSLGRIVIESVRGVRCAYTARMHQTEIDLAYRFLTLAHGEKPWRVEDPAAEIAWAQEHVGITLAPSQREALIQVLGSKVSVITGGPGVGKTTLTRSLLEILNKLGMHVTLCAPTGRAAKRMAESTGREAKTVHRMLGFDPSSKGFKHDQNKPLETDVVILDECSMVDVSLLNSVIKAVPKHGAFLMVGDVNQLPSVGPGQALADVLGSGVVTSVHLREIFRQAASSKIIVNAHRINQGEFPEKADPKGPASDFFFIRREQPEEISGELLDLVAKRLPKHYGFHPMRDIQVLCPMIRTPLGTRALNAELQKALNPRGAEQPSVERYGNKFLVGDKVMVTQNDYEKDVFNGDVGFIHWIDPEEEKVSIDFDGRMVDFEFTELDSVVLAYATTIHKSQGSEYPCVVLPVSTQHFMMLRRNLIYTGVTRGKKLVVLIGQVRALGMALTTQDGLRRWTNLEERLRAGVGSMAEISALEAGGGKAGLPALPDEEWLPYPDV